MIQPEKELLLSLHKLDARTPAHIQLPAQTYYLLTELGLIETDEDMCRIALNYAEWECENLILPPLIKTAKMSLQRRVAIALAFDFKLYKDGCKPVPFIADLIAKRYCAAMVFLSKPLSCFQGLQ